MDRDGGNKERMRKCKEWLFLHFHPEALSSMNMLQNLFRFIESLRTALSDSESRYVWFWQCSSTFKMQPSEINLAFSEPWMASLAVLIHWLVRLAYIFATRPSRHWRKVQWLFHQYCIAMQLNFELQHFPVAGPDRSGNFPDRIDLKHNLSRLDGQTSCLLSDRP